MHANDHRINCLARQALVKLGEQPDRSQVYSVQLMRWALEAGVVRRSEMDLTLMRETVEALGSTRHEQVMQILQLCEDAPGRPGLQPRHLIDKAPRELAGALLRDLAGKLAGRLESVDHLLFVPAPDQREA